MKRFATLGVVVVWVLMAVGIWIHGSSYGYERGKADAMTTVRPYGFVLVEKDGSCKVYDKPWQTVTVFAGVAKLVVLLQK